MNVTRKVQIVTEDFVVGDVITVNIKGLGEFTATAQKITETGTLFMFDDCVIEKEREGLEEWLRTEFTEMLPDEIKESLMYVSLPTYGMMFGHDNWYNNFNPDDDEQLPLMKKRKNRVADYKDDYAWYWLENEHKRYAAYFAVVSNSGNATYSGASVSCGVRPVFELVR